MNKLKSLLALTAASTLLAACSQGNSAPPVVTQKNPATPGYAKLQFAVGTANVNGDTNAINVVSTLRQPNGESAVLVSTPTISGPWTLLAAAPAGGGVDPYATIAANGPSLSDFGSNTLSGTSQTVHLGAPPCDTSGTVNGFATCPAGTAPNTSTFGQSGGVFGMGLQPANATTNTTPYTTTPFAQPIFVGNAAVAPSAASAAFLPWGGPPAFDDSSNGMGTRDGLHNLAGIGGGGLLGWNDGINVVMLAAPPSNKQPGYLISVSIPTGQNSSGQSSFTTVTANANLNPAKVLPTITAPTLTLDGNGGGTLAVTLPAGATEGYVTIVDIGAVTAANTTGGPNCQGALGPSTSGGQGILPVYYTIFVNASGTYTLPDTIGPNLTQKGPTSLTPSPSICSSAQNSAALGAPTPGDTYTVQFFAMDYPLHEASYPANATQTPVLAGAVGTADITISAVAKPPPSP